MMKLGRKKSAKRAGLGLSNIKITYKLTGLLIALLVGFGVIGLAYTEVLKVESESLALNDKMSAFEAGIHEVQVDLLNARYSESEFYLKKYPILLGKFDTRIIVASQNLNGLTSLVKGEEKLSIVTDLGEAFENYREKFIKAAETQIDIGLDENTGLISDLIRFSGSLDESIKNIKNTSFSLSFLELKSLENELLQQENTRLKKVFSSYVEDLKDSIKRSKVAANIKNNTLSLLDSYNGVFSDISDKTVLLKSLKKDVKTAAKQIEPLFEKLLEISQTIIANSKQRSADKRQQITTFFIGILVVTSLLVTVALFMLARSIISPIRKLQDTVLKVNQGDMTARTHMHQRDELGTLAHAFDTLLDERVANLAEAEKQSEVLNESVIELIKAVSKLAQDKDLGTKIPVSEDITGAISDSLNLLAKETAKIMRDVKSTSNQVAEVSSTVKKQADHVISVANKERKEVEATAELLKKSYDTMTVIANDSQDANEQATRTIENTQRAVESVLSSVEGINTIRNTISETEKRIKRLGERSQEISGIVSLINSISERTHILALNASMHAASAGEAGRGFAVVAEEVQRLAENARDATLEISTVVNNIRVETADTVTTMNAAISQVAEGTRLAEQASNSMKETQQATSELVRSVKHIANSSVSQAEITKQLLERAKVIQQTTAQTSRELLEQTKSTDVLVRYSAELVTSVGVFKLPGEEVQVVETAAIGEMDTIREAG